MTGWGGGVWGGGRGGITSTRAAWRSISRCASIMSCSTSYLLISVGGSATGPRGVSSTTHENSAPYPTPGSRTAVSSKPYSHTIRVGYRSCVAHMSTCYLHGLIECSPPVPRLIKEFNPGFKVYCITRLLQNTRKCRTIKRCRSNVLGVEASSDNSDFEQYFLQGSRTCLVSC